MKSHIYCITEPRVLNLLYIPLLKVVQFNSVAQSCPTLCDLMNRSMPGLPVHHQLPEFTQTHVHWVGDAIQPSNPLLSPSPPVLIFFPASGSFQMSQLFASGGQNIGVSASAVLPKAFLLANWKVLTYWHFPSLFKIACIIFWNYFLVQRKIYLISKPLY